MHPLVEVALVNAGMAAILAVPAALLARIFRRPTVTHVLWCLVLVKLVTPPLFRLPLVDRDWVAGPAVSLVSLVEASLADSTLTVEKQFDPTESSDPQLIPNGLRPRSLPPANSRKFDTPKRWMLYFLGILRRESVQQLVGRSLLIIWGSGTIVWFLVQGLRCLRFHRMMIKSGSFAPQETQRLLAELGQRSDCSTVPPVWLMPDVLSPMLWSVGRTTRLIFPTALMARLDVASRETLLAHELAHFQRGDHWVRLICLLATGIFWWHPVVWWARYSIEAAEEECCDAWVITRGKIVPRKYAEAILEAIDFVAERPWKVPPLGTGLGQMTFMRQRMIWIMRGPRLQNFTLACRIACSIIALALPFQPTWLVAKSRNAHHALSLGELRFEGGSNVDLSVDFTDEIADVHNGQVINNVLSNEVLSGSASLIPGYFGEIAISSNDEQSVVFVGSDRQWLSSRASGVVVDLSPFAIRTATFSNDGTTVFTGGMDGVIRLWNAETGDALASWQAASGPVSSLTVSSDDHWIVSGTRDGFVRVWEFNSHHAFIEIIHEGAPISCVRFSDDCQSLAVATGDPSKLTAGRISIWNTGDWSERVSMNWNQATTAVAFGEDRHSLYSGDWLGRIARWNADSGELLGFVEGHQATVLAASISPETSRLADVTVPELPLDLLIGDARQDEKVKSIWDQVTSRAAELTRSFRSSRRPRPMP